MSWELIDNLKPAAGKAEGVPADGVRIAPRMLRRAKGGPPVRWINVQIGADLARKLSLVQESVRVRLMIGSGTDLGKVAIAVDATAGNYLAKRQNKGGYFVAINAPSAEGRFNLEFDAFAVPRIEVVRPQNGQPVMCAFRVAPALLAREVETI